MRTSRGVLVGLVGLMVLVSVACGGGSPQEVEVRLKEWSVSASVGELKAGKTTFVATNEGTGAHELLVIKEDLPPDELPLADVGVDEKRVNVRGVIDEVAPGGTQRLTLDLSPGKYVLLCNVVDLSAGATAASHYRNGMATSLLVLP